MSTPTIHTAPHSATHAWKPRRDWPLFWLPIERPAKLRSIGVYGDPRQMEVPLLELTTQSGSRIFWGSPPGSEPPGEATADMKIQKLLSVDTSQPSDLRIANPIIGIQR